MESGQRLVSVVSAEPRNRVVREQLSIVYEGLEEWGRAEGVLLEGVQWSRDTGGYESLLGHYLRRMEKATEGTVDYRSFSYALMRLARAQGASAEVVLSMGIEKFQNLIEMRGLDEVLEGLHEASQDWLVEGGDPAVAHMGLGMIDWSRGESQRGKWHIEQAMRIDGRARGCAERVLEEMRGRLGDSWLGRIDELAGWVRGAKPQDLSTLEDSGRDRP